MNLLIYIILFLALGYILGRGATILVKSLVNIARFLRISEYALSFVLMALATSTPELFIGISSAFQNIPQLTIGNIIGSNIIKLTLVIGIIALLARNIPVKSEITKKDAWFVFIIASLPMVFILDGELSRIEGGVLVGLFIWYLIVVLSEQKRFKKRVNHNNRKNIKKFFRNVLSFFFGIIILLGTSWTMVQLSTLIAQEINFSLILVGLILVSLSTNLPELTFGIKATLAKHEEMSLGNLIGATAVDSGLILGIVALISPIKITDFPSFWTGAIFMIISILLFNVFIRTKSKLSWLEGIALILFYVIFIGVNIWFR